MGVSAGNRAVMILLPSLAVSREMLHLPPPSSAADAPCAKTSKHANRIKTRGSTETSLKQRAGRQIDVSLKQTPSAKPPNVAAASPEKLA
jgi:hypothetical protein